MSSESTDQLQNSIPDAIKDRYAVRAALLTPDHELLLMKLRAPSSLDGFWVTPGGGIQDGETPERALRRELEEELGLTEFTTGPILIRRDHTFHWLGRHIRQREQIHLIRINKFAPHMSDAVEARVTEAFKWWPIAELASTTESITPRTLASLIEDFLRAESTAPGSYQPPFEHIAESRHQKN